MSSSIRGIQEAQQANLKLIRAVKPQNGTGRAAKTATFSLQRYAVAITHVLTGSLKGSHRIEQLGPAKFRIYIDPSSKNPRTGEAPAVYGIYEHSKGGSHAFYERTVMNYGSRASSEGFNVLIREF